MTDTGAPLQAFHGRQVEALAGFGIPDAEIAHVLRIHLVIRRPGNETAPRGGTRRLRRVSRLRGHTSQIR